MTEIIHIDEALTVQTVVSYQELCNHALAKQSHITVDVSQVKRFDTAGLQWLLYWHNHGGVQFTGFINPAIQSHLARFGLLDMFIKTELSNG